MNDMAVVNDVPFEVVGWARDRAEGDVIRRAFSVDRPADKPEDWYAIYRQVMS